MNPVTLHPVELIALCLAPAGLVALALRYYYHGRLRDTELDKHISQEALRNQMKVQTGILRDRLNEEREAHLHTISLLTRGSEREGEIHVRALEQTLRLHESQDDFSDTNPKNDNPGEAHEE